MVFTWANFAADRRGDILRLPLHQNICGRVGSRNKRSYIRCKRAVRETGAIPNSARRDEDLIVAAAVAST